MKSFRQVSLEAKDRLKQELATKVVNMKESLHVHMGAKVQSKNNKDKNKPFTVTKIVSDDTVEVTDEYGNKHKMLIADLDPSLTESFVTLETQSEKIMKTQDLLKLTEGMTPQEKDNLQQELANQDINSVHRDGKIHVHPDDHAAAKKVAKRFGLEKHVIKESVGQVSSEHKDLPDHVKKMINDVATSSAKPEHKQAAIDAIVSQHKAKQLKESDLHRAVSDGMKDLLVSKDHETFRKVAKHLGHPEWQSNPSHADLKDVSHRRLQSAHDHIYRGTPLKEEALDEGAMDTYNARLAAELPKRIQRAADFIKKVEAMGTDVSKAKTICDSVCGTDGKVNLEKLNEAIKLLLPIERMM